MFWNFYVEEKAEGWRCLFSIDGKERGEFVCVCPDRRILVFTALCNALHSAMHCTFQCTAMHCTLQYTALKYCIAHCNVLHCNTIIELWWTHCTVMHLIALWCTSKWWTALHCTVSTSCDILNCDTVTELTLTLLKTTDLRQLNGAR